MYSGPVLLMPLPNRPMKVKKSPKHINKWSVAFHHAWSLAGACTTVNTSPLPHTVNHIVVKIEK